MTTFVIVLTSGIFALAAVIGLIDLFVHLVCKSAQALRTPGALIEPDKVVVQTPVQSRTA